MFRIFDPVITEIKDLVEDQITQLLLDHSTVDLKNNNRSIIQVRNGLHAKKSLRISIFGTV